VCQYTETEEILKILILKFLVNFLNLKFGLIFWNSGSRAIEASSWCETLQCRNINSNNNSKQIIL